jgi:hypothetical protein
MLLPQRACSFVTSAALGVETANYFRTSLLNHATHANLAAVLKNLHWHSNWQYRRRDAVQR